MADPYVETRRRLAELAALPPEELELMAVCDRELLRLRPVHRGSDEENLREIERIREAAEFFGSFREGPPRPAPVQRCPQDRLEKMYRERREDDLRWLRDHPRP